MTKRSRDDAPARTVDATAIQQIFNSAPALYAVVDRGYTVLAVTDAYLRTTGKHRDEILGRNLFDVFPNDPNDPAAAGVERVRESIDRVVATGGSDAMAVLKHPILRAEPRGGSFEEHHWSLVHHPALDDRGEVFAIIHRVEDVTDFVRLREQGLDHAQLDAELRARLERMEADVIRRAQEIEESNRKLREANHKLNDLRQQLEFKAALREEALRTSDERYRLLVEGVKEYAIFMLDREGNVVSWSPTAEHIHGYDEHEILGRDYSCFFTREDQAAGIPGDQLQVAAADGSIATRDWKVRKDGSTFWASSVTTALYDDHGSVCGFAKVSRDMTEQRRTEVVLQSIVNTAIDGIITIDSNGSIQTFSRSAERIFGYAAEEVVGENVRILMPEPYRSEHDGYLESYLRTGVAKIIGVGREAQGRRKDGSTFPLELSVSQFEQDGQPCFTGLIRDTSTRRKMELQLRQAQKMEAVGQLAAGVAHDFNNLLTVISGYGELALMTLAAEDKTRPMIAEVRRAAERATSLTRQLLAFSRQQVLELKVFDLNEVIGDTQRMLHRLIGEDVELVTILAQDLSRVKADPGQVDQVLINLAVNARDAMPLGGTLTIETRNVEIDTEYAANLPGVAPGPYVLMAVSDTGCGMTPEVRLRIFEPFFTTKGVGKGSGLGLSVIDGIVRQTGGHVDVYSEVDVGTVFKVYLPAVREAASAGAVPSAAERPVGAETLLVVEDDSAVRALAVVALQQFGYTVLEAASGIAALEAVDGRDGKVDLVVTDVVMPGMSGRKLAEAIHARFPAIPILFMSGYTDDSVVRHGILRAEIEFLQKPFTPGTLGRKVREVLDRKENPGQAPVSANQGPGPDFP